MGYSIEADNYWSYDYCEDCGDEESSACEDYDDFLVAASDYIEAIKNNCDIGIKLLTDTLLSCYSYYINKDENDEEYKDMVENGYFGARLLLRDNETGYPVAYANRKYIFSIKALDAFDEIEIFVNRLSPEQKEFIQSVIPDDLEVSYLNY